MSEVPLYSSTRPSAGISGSMGRPQTRTSPPWEGVGAIGAFGSNPPPRRARPGLWPTHREVTNAKRPLQGNLAHKKTPNPGPP